LFVVFFSHTNEELLHFNLAAAVQCAKRSAGGASGALLRWFVDALFLIVVIVAAI